MKNISKIYISKVCNELNDNRIAVIAIGDCPVFIHLNGIARSLKIPYLAIKWDAAATLAHGLDEENVGRNSRFTEEDFPYNLNIHPPASKLLQALTDLIEYYKWEYITILYMG